MSDETLSRDQLFDILSSPRRRYVLYYLREQGDPIELTALAEKLAAWQDNTALEDVSPQDRKRMYVSLYQTHIPKLEEAGLITYDPDSGEISLVEEQSAVDHYLNESGNDRPWHWYYLGLTVTNIGLLGGVLAGAVQISLPLTVGIAIGSVLLLAAVHTLASRRDTQPEFDTD
jgi:DNA-binding transcriptional ArsR family regulator